jgi:hypothetical protein
MVVGTFEASEDVARSPAVVFPRGFLPVWIGIATVAGIIWALGNIESAQTRLKQVAARAGVSEAQARARALRSVYES